MEYQQAQLTAQRVVKMWRAALGENGKPISLRKFVAELNTVPGARPITYQAAGLWNVGRTAPHPERALSNYLLATENSWQRAFWRDMLGALQSSGK